MKNIILYELIKTNMNGLIVKRNGQEKFVGFEECALNYARKNGFENSKCVAERDITNLTFSFFATELIRVKFKRSLIRALVTRKTAIHRFRDLQQFIVESGYSSFDLS